jgi:endonuclease/exonuclease/phosphatase family metal-dependent hydrolase
MLLRAVCLGGLALVLGGCNDRDVWFASVPSGALSLATFNTAIGVGLAPFAAQRLDAIERDLPGLDADVLCLQELWQPDDLERIASALQSEYPYTHRSVGAGGIGQQACTADEASQLQTCLNENCAGVGNAGLPLCAIANCAMAFTQVATSCQQCIVANMDAPDVNELVRICGPAGQGEAVAFENQTGLLLLSRLPLEQTDFLELESALGDRGVLSARVSTGLGALDVYCTHLAATLGNVPYEGQYGSWAGERVEQIERFLDWVAQTRAPGGAAALLGDMNCGPETPLARAASPDAFERFVAAGFEDPYATSDGRCTFCANNPLNGLVSDPEEGAFIDHVLLSSSAGTASSGARVLDDVFSVDGSSMQIAHSDHYGVQVTITGAGSAP